MKTAALFKILFLFLIILVISGFVPAKRTSIGKINFILGSPNDVTVMRAGNSEWENAKLYSSIYNGDQIKTNKESRCETKLHKQGIIRIGENTTFSFQPDQLNNSFSTEIKKGRLWANIKKLVSRSNFHVRTPTAVCSIRGTIYRIDADSSTKVMVYQGTVDVGPLWAVKRDTSSVRQPGIYQPPYEVPGPTQIPGPFEVSLDQWVRIVAGQQIEVRADGKYYKSKINEQVDQEDDWVKWNRERDGMQ
jgi:hypothetical protein